MRILIINQHIADVLGGSEIQCDLIAEYLTKKGHDVYYYAINGDVNKRYNTLYAVIPSVLSTEQLSYYLNVVQPDIVYWRFNKKGVSFAFPLIKRKKIKLVFAVSAAHDVKKWVWRLPSTTPETNFVKFLYHYIKTIYKSLRERLAYNYLKYADGVVYLSKDFYNKLPVNTQTVIHNSMSTKVEPFNWPRPFVVWVASIKAIKNPHVFLELSQSLKIEGIDFIMVGRIVDKKYNYLKGKSGKDNFYYLGSKTPTEVNGVLKKSLFLVHTCDPEGFGNNFIQAWLQGKPTISLNFDPEGLIRDNNIGFISNSFEMLARDVKKLVEQRSLREEMGHRASALAHKEFNSQNNVHKLEQFFKGLLT